MTIDDRRSYWWWANYCKEKMLPCPFCGGEGRFDVDHVLGSLVYIVYCKRCRVEKRFGETSWWEKENKGSTKFTNQQMYRGLSAKALNFWNKRAMK